MDLRFAYMCEQLPHSTIRSFESTLRCDSFVRVLTRHARRWGKRKTARDDLRIADEQGKTALMIAIEQSNVKLVKLILTVYDEFKELDINRHDAYGFTAFHAACVASNEDILLTLLERSDLSVNDRTEDGVTGFHYICKNYRSPNIADIIEKLVEKGLHSQGHTGN
jgi:ankyrin repeat protein